MLTPPFAVSQFTTMPRSLASDLSTYRQAGVEALEVCGIKLSSDLSTAADQLQEVVQAGFRITSYQPAIHSCFPDSIREYPSSTTARLAEYHRSIDLLGDLFPDSGLPLVFISGVAPDADFAGAHRILRAALREIAQHARERGLRIGFEPLHPVLLHLDTFVWQLQTALDLIADIDDPGLGLVVDTWNLGWQPEVPKLLSDFDGTRIVAVHLADWRLPFAAADRLLPGEGDLALSHFLQAIHTSGYRGAYTLEVLSEGHVPGSLWQQDPVSVIERGRAGFEYAWETMDVTGSV